MSTIDEQLHPTDLEIGPVDYLVVEFPGNRMTGEGFAILLDLVDSGTIRLLDLVFVRRDADGSYAAIEISDVDADGALDLAVFAGAGSGLIGADDIDDAAAVLSPGNSAGILVYENRWAAPFAAAVRRGGGQVAASGRIPVETLVASLEAVEAADSSV